ncbi:hypothetical protein HK097_001952 [Rhizophlyctis rosea]|uniref:Uncharacterized protein n=1 Tax=Rhizophlyctis rosea TaxID=64517 RepID=A0AAD5S410_9FUNG|nr:hypothetical protein HK097_001952 [Rhizophlyctis rosea]
MSLLETSTKRHADGSEEVLFEQLAVDLTYFDLFSLIDELDTARRIHVEGLIKTMDWVGEASEWVAKARTEEQSSRHNDAREILAIGRIWHPSSEVVWFESARLNAINQAKLMLIQASRNILQSIKLWLHAAELESDPHLKKQLLCRALQYIPSSFKMWKALVSLEDDPEDARILLFCAVECISSSAEFWLALARLESWDNAKNVLLNARIRNPTSYEFWISFARLGEKAENGKMVETIVNRAVAQLDAKGLLLGLDRWGRLPEKYGESLEGPFGGSAGSPPLGDAGGANDFLGLGTAIPFHTGYWRWRRGAGKVLGLDGAGADMENVDEDDGDGGEGRIILFGDVEAEKWRGWGSRFGVDYNDKSLESLRERREVEWVWSAEEKITFLRYVKDAEAVGEFLEEDPIAAVRRLHFSHLGARAERLGEVYRPRVGVRGDRLVRGSKAEKMKQALEDGCGDGNGAGEPQGKLVAEVVEAEYAQFLACVKGIPIRTEEVKKRMKIKKDLFTNRVRNNRWQVGLMKEMEEILDEPCRHIKFDVHTSMLAFRKGVYKPRTSTFHEEKRVFMEAWVAEIMPYEDDRFFLNMVLCMALEQCNVHKILIISLVDGGNGKGLIKDFMLEAPDQDVYCNAPVEELLKCNRPASCAASLGLLNLSGATVIFLSEPNARQEIKNSTVKGMIGNDSMRNW